ncbi:MAG: hypothetical protein WC202_10945 [Desulfobacterales bacterium]
MNAVIECEEREYAPFFAWCRRRRDGWKWRFHLGGPSWLGSLGFLSPFIGIWCFARPPRRLCDIPREEYLQCTIVTTCASLGSYGTGGPGFFGLQCRKKRKTFWIIFTLRGADGWLTLNGRLIASSLSEADKKTYAKQGNIATEAVHGGTLASVKYLPSSIEIKIQQEDAEHVIELRRDGKTVPAWRESGEKKQFRDTELLEDALVVSRRANLWTEG